MTPAFSKRDRVLAAAIFLGTVLLFVRTVEFSFVNIDDALYVPGNTIVERGLTLDGVRYAFTSRTEGNYLPLTWLSHMAAVELGGTSPAIHHAVNVGLHGLAAALLFVFLRLATGSAGRSAAVAVLWAAHPLRVESVAWVAERKDVLSGVFWMLGLLVYWAYARRPGIARYAAVALVTALGLLSKSIVVVLPCVFLLLDLWPLGRVRLGEPGTGRRMAMLVAEKIPLLLLSLSAGSIAIWTQDSAGALRTTEAVPMATRLWNASASCATYLAQTIWPWDLAVFYPFPDNRSLYAWGGLGLILVVIITGFALYRYRTRPYLAVGWFWFLGTLAPVIGFIQVGVQAHADRYTYLPHVGLFIAGVWAAADTLERWPRTAVGRLPATLAVMLVCAALTWRQTGFWRTSETLFAHTLAVTGPNPLAEGNYAVALTDRGLYAEAEVHLRRAIEIDPTTFRDPYNLGGVLLKLDRPREAREMLERASRINPHHAGCWMLLGNANLMLQEPRRAMDAYREVRRLGDNSIDLYTNVGIALKMEGRVTEAEAEFRQALMLSPQHTPALFNLAVLAIERRDAAEAAALLERVLTNSPEDAEAMYYLAAVRGWQGRDEEAVEMLQQALRLAPRYRERARADALFEPLRTFEPFKLLVESP
jgi:tetratricopeptide (TPR) repeat protein